MRLELVFLDNLPINVNVILNHSGEGEVLLNMAAARAPVDRIEPPQRDDHALQGIYKKAGFPVYHNFRQGAPLHRQNGRSAGHGFDRNQTERLLPLNWKQSGYGMLVPMVLLRGV